jgi:hypothetical protein
MVDYGLQAKDADVIDEHLSNRKKTLASDALKYTLDGDTLGQKQILKVHPGDNISLRGENQDKKEKKTFKDMEEAATHLRSIGMKPDQLQEVLGHYANKKQALMDQLPKVMTKVNKDEMFKKKMNLRAGTDRDITIDPRFARVGRYMGPNVGWQFKTFTDWMDPEFEEWAGDDTAIAQDKWAKLYWKAEDKTGRYAGRAAKPLKRGLFSRAFSKGPSQYDMRARQEYLQGKGTFLTDDERGDLDYISKNLRQNPHSVTITQETKAPTLAKPKEPERTAAGFLPGEELKEVVEHDGEKYKIGTLGSEVKVGGGRTFLGGAKKILYSVPEIGKSALDTFSAVLGDRVKVAKRLANKVMDEFQPTDSSSTVAKLGYGLTKAALDKPALEHEEWMDQRRRRREQRQTLRTDAADSTAARLEREKTRTGIHGQHLERRRATGKLQTDAETDKVDLERKKAKLDVDVLDADLDLREKKFKLAEAERKSVMDEQKERISFNREEAKREFEHAEKNFKHIVEQYVAGKLRKEEMTTAFANAVKPALMVGCSLAALFSAGAAWPVALGIAAKAARPIIECLGAATSDKFPEWHNIDFRRETFLSSAELLGRRRAEEQAAKVKALKEEMKK